MTSSERIGAMRATLRHLWVASVLSLLLQACSNPTVSEDGPFRITVKTIKERHYGGDGGADVVAGYGEDGIIVWESPVDGGPIVGVYVELNYGSQSNDLAYAPVQSWLRSQGASRPVSIRLTGRSGRRASGVRINDPERLLLGQILAVSAPHPDYRTRRIETTEFVVSRGDYIETQWPVFTSMLRISDPLITMRAIWERDKLKRSGTYVGAWVLDTDDEGDEIYVPVDTWLADPDRYSPSNLYISEIAWRPRFRDRFFRLVGETLVVAHVAQ